MGAASDQVRRCRRYAARISWSRLEQSLEAEPSTARPTGTPSCSNFRDAAHAAGELHMDTGQ